MNLEKMKKNLSDAGCDIVSAETILKMCETGNLEDALWQMKKKRCDLMDELHESGRKVDCLDFLIRGIKKELIRRKEGIEQ